MRMCWCVGDVLTGEQKQQLAEMLRVLGEPNRLSLIVCCLDSAQVVGALTDRIGLSQSLVSHHLRLLRAARLLKAQHRGKQVSRTSPAVTSRAC